MDDEKKRGFRFKNSTIRNMAKAAILFLCQKSLCLSVQRKKKIQGNFQMWVALFPWKEMQCSHAARKNHTLKSVSIWC